MSVGFLVDNLTSVMLLVVSFVSLMVHIYTIGYMQEDEGYTKFFSYISLFTFAMFMLVISNNFMQLFFGWEAVGLVSYLLIGFWHHKESAVEASLKAFLVNRVGDFGFLLGIAVLLMFFGTLDYVETFTLANQVNGQTIFGDISVNTVICLLLFIGAMGKFSTSTIACLVARLNGRSDTYFSFDPCGNYGYGWYFYGLTYVAYFRTQ